MAHLHSNPIGQTIRTLRRTQELTQVELARRAKLERGHLARIETGKTMPGLCTLEKLAKALHTTASRLLAA